MTPLTIPEPAANVPPLVPERYEALQIVGQGAMGVVYKARDRDLDRVVAIKTIHPNSAVRGPDFDAIAARLCREAMAAARLAHPGIVTIYDVGRTSETPYIVMEYFTGRTLAEILDAGALPPERAVQIVLQVCRALEYAHAQGVVHRDIKTSNIMVDAEWNAKLSDFGVARIVDKPTNETKMMVGTPAYMSPEQARGASADARSDLFAVGVVLYEALTGAKAFPGEDVATVLDKVLRVDPVPPRERNFAVSPAVDAVVRRAMEKEPQDRYPDAAAFAEALTQATETAGVVGRMLSAPRVRAALFLVAILTGVGAGVFAARLVGQGRATVSSGSDEAQVVTRRHEEPTSITTEPLAGGAPESRRAAPPRVGPTPVNSPTRDDVEVPASTAEWGCVSVNAVPFAKVYVDGRPVGDTPQACVRVRQGQHRIRFEWTGERSPDYLVTVARDHTADNPLRASYDFKAGRFVPGTE